MKDLHIVCHTNRLEDIFSEASKDICLMLENCLKNQQPSLNDIEKLFLTKGKDKQAVLNFADFLQNKVNGNNVTFVINRNLSLIHI